jgi:hypothetical protein
VFNISFVVLQ